jgi:hypothetical protein
MPSHTRQERLDEREQQVFEFYACAPSNKLRGAWGLHPHRGPRTRVEIVKLISDNLIPSPSYSAGLEFELTGVAQGVELA